MGVNVGIGIYSKTGTLLASFTENNLWASAAAPPCTGNSQGDPVVLYDKLANRWILTWFAFAVSGGAPVSPFYQCIAASKSSDPVAGGWWLYAARIDTGSGGQPPVGNLNDYGKFGLWHDCLYAAFNEFLFPAESFSGVAFASFNRSDLYKGAPLNWALGFLPYPANPIFTMVPSNNNGSGLNAVQPGTPDYFVSESLTLFAFDVRKFTAGANCGGGGSLGAATSVTQTSYPAAGAHFGNVVPQPNTGTTLDNIDDRIMQKVQYRKVGGAESLWVTHNVDTAAGLTAMQWAQINVTGATVVTTPVQQQIYTPDSTLYRWMGSIVADGQGNVALGYSTSNGTSPNFPSIAYSGRLATDPPNTLPQTETQMIAGGGSQANTCGGNPCHRWGDYTAMAIDPDDCTFWYVNEYYDNQTSGNSGNWHTRVGSFKYPSCPATGFSSTSDLVYKALEPCRIMDTRNATIGSGVQGPIVGNALYHVPGYINSGANWGQYGGNGSSDCGLTNPPGQDIHAVAIVITILNPNFDAFLGVSDVNGLSTVLSNVALNYTHGQGLSTMYIVPQLSTNNIYFAMPASLSAQLIFDVVGYYTVSDATALQCTQQVSAMTPIAGSGGTGTATSPACGAGYALSSGSCEVDIFGPVLYQHEASGNSWVCSAINRGGSTANLTAKANCCRVPGK